MCYMFCLFRFFHHIGVCVGKRASVNVKSTNTSTSRDGRLYKCAVVDFIPFVNMIRLPRRLHILH